eukprot:scaffold92173_cov92-Phaeocystis_antarctica.AAC.1
MVMPLVSEADMARGAAPLLRAMHQELLEAPRTFPCAAQHGQVPCFFASLLPCFLASPASLLAHFPICYSCR